MLFLVFPVVKHAFDPALAGILVPEEAIERRNEAADQRAVETEVNLQPAEFKGKLRVHGPDCDGKNRCKKRRKKSCNVFSVSMDDHRAAGQRYDGKSENENMQQ